jgi:hypothetical protein
MADLGSDWAGVTDITPDLREVTGRQCLAEALATRLFQPRGGVFYDERNGFDTRSLLSSESVPRNAKQSILEQLKDEDDRVELASVDFALNEATGALVIVCQIVDAEGPFTLVLNPKDASFEILNP